MIAFFCILFQRQGIRLIEIFSALCFPPENRVIMQILFIFLEILSSSISISSAPPPPQQAGAFSRGVVTMKCDISTCSAAHISLLVSGSAQTCFDDQVTFIPCLHCFLVDSLGENIFIYCSNEFSAIGKSYKEGGH